MALSYNELPSWLAWPAAWASPSEGQVTVAKAREQVLAYLEYACVLLLADIQARGQGYDARSEATMRYAMTRPMGFSEWLAVFRALGDGERAQSVLGLDIVAERPAGSAIAAACTVLAATPASVGAFLEAIAPERGVDPTAGPRISDAAAELVQASSTLAGYVPCFVRAVRTIDDEAFEVRYQPLLGTGFLETKMRRFWREPPLTEGRLVFWDLARSAVPVPEWLMLYDQASRVPWLWNGRSNSDEWLYVSRNPAASPRSLHQAPQDMPVFLAEPTWQTPLPAARRLGPGFDPGEPAPETQQLRMDEVQDTIQRLMAQAAELEDDGDLTAEATLVLKVLGSRSFMNYLELKSGTDVVLGRSADHADFVVDDVKVSRKNTRVRVERSGRVFATDLGSTNGTRLNGLPVGPQPVPIRPMDTLQVGPVMLRVEPLDSGQRKRIDQILEFVDQPHRDPLTGLLKPHVLARELELPDNSLTESITGVVVYIDGLSGIHASAGHEKADTIFLCVSRLIMAAMAEPSLCVRVGYGECLALLRGEGAKAGVDMARMFLESIERWPTAEPVSVVAGVVEAEPGEPLEDWIRRARETTLRGLAGDGGALTATSKQVE